MRKVRNLRNLTILMQFFYIRKFVSYTLFYLLSRYGICLIPSLYEDLTVTEKLGGFLGDGGVVEAFFYKFYILKAKTYSNTILTYLQIYMSIGCIMIVAIFVKCFVSRVLFI